jgi:hypothetical protein
MGTRTPQPQRSNPQHELARHVPARAARVRRQEAVFRSARLRALPAVPAYRRSPQTLFKRLTPSNSAVHKTLHKTSTPEHKTSTHVSRCRRRPFIGDPLSSARARTPRAGVLLQTRPSSPRAQRLKNPCLTLNPPAPDGTPRNPKRPGNAPENFGSAAGGFTQAPGGQAG